jgi:4-carboxymuconolactone decarboxylase
MSTPSQPHDTESQTLQTLHKTLFDTGLKNRREVVGDVYVNKALANGDSEFAWPGQELVTE